MKRRLSLAALAAAALSCGTYETMDEHPCPPGGTALTYADFGAHFFDRNCQTCHASDAADREGAPGEFAFDTHEQIKRHAERIYVRAAGPNDSMPPGPDDPEASEREQLADWLACGAP